MGGDEALFHMSIERKLATAVAVLELIAAPVRSDGTWNRDRRACQMLALAALEAFGAPPITPNPPPNGSP